MTLTVWAWRRRKAVGTKGSLNESVTKVFVEQPLASPGSAKKIGFCSCSCSELLQLKFVKIYFARKRKLHRPQDSYKYEVTNKKIFYLFTIL